MVEKLKFLNEQCANLLKNYFLVDVNENYVVLRHGDCWMNNFLFHYDENEINPDKVAVIDWQMSMIGSPMSDLAFFLFYGCSKTELDHLDDLLDFYYDNLSNNLRKLGSEPETCFPKGKVMETFKKYALAAIVGMPLMVKISYVSNLPEKCDYSEVGQEGGFNCDCEEKLRDEEGYIRRLDGLLKLCIERGFL
ncbi:hypothetical protein HHI36_005355 [Cryptolaemus montrouzieri]|uniref:CHK kinase-like domain-containing protein n=1 Tax=Cryptolaemus montrouzieri TaxID=559131 RepID=A0ABD2NU60_9CUCU